MNLQSQDLWAALPVPVLIIGTDCDVVNANPTAESFLNLSARSLLGKPITRVIGLDDQVREALGRACADNAPLVVSDVILSTGVKRDVRGDLRLSPITPDQPGTDMMLLITPDEMAGRLGQDGTARSGARSAIGMAEMMAHEIKNPLSGIIGAAQLLSMGLDADGREMTDLIVAESRRIVKLLDQVEQFGNLTPPDLRETNVHNVLDRARRSALLGFGADMVIHERYDPSLPLALADADHLLQVVQNLLKNAAEAAGQAGGTITLRTYYEHGFTLRRSDDVARPLPLQIEVVDDGPGLPDAIRNDVFDAFVSGRENGTGLGLALASKIITAHGGLITVSSRPGRTVFRISLQRADKAAPRKKEP